MLNAFKIEKKIFSFRTVDGCRVVGNGYGSICVIYTVFFI